MNATHALGWALVHFLWQGAILAVLLGVALGLTPPRAARTRYTLSLLTLAAMLLSPLATGLRLYQPDAVIPATPALGDVHRSSAPGHQSRETAPVPPFGRAEAAEPA